MEKVGQLKYKGFPLHFNYFLFLEIKAKTLQNYFFVLLSFLFEFLIHNKCTHWERKKSESLKAQ